AYKQAPLSVGDSSNLGAPDGECLTKLSSSVATAAAAACEAKESEKREEQVDDVEVDAHREQDRHTVGCPARSGDAVQIENEEAGEEHRGDRRNPDIQQRHLNEDADH